MLDDYGMPINASARMSFDPFGKRRAATTWTTPTPWSTTLGNELKDTTRHGYTGHEQVDAVGIIHMGGHRFWSSRYSNLVEVGTAFWLKPVR